MNHSDNMAIPPSPSVNADHLEEHSGISGKGDDLQRDANGNFLPWGPPAGSDSLVQSPVHSPSPVSPAVRLPGRPQGSDISDRYPPDTPSSPLSRAGSLNARPPSIHIQTIDSPVLSNVVPDMIPSIQLDQRPMAVDSKVVAAAQKLAADCTPLFQHALQQLYVSSGFV
jgi:hypothetical protein